MVHHVVASLVVGGGEPLHPQSGALPHRAALASLALRNVVHVNNLLFEADREKKTHACLLSLYNRRAA